MKQHLLNVLAAQRALRKAADELANAWCADESSRNRPGRQRLTEKLMESLPKPAVVGDAVYRIADDCGIDLDA
jgi:hypothetical protein